MMKTESFNWQRPAKICNGVKDFGLLREKFANAEDIKRRSFSSIYISRAIFIVGVIAVITFVICLVLADKYQKSVNLSHHYASFVYEKNQHGERLFYGGHRNRENEQADKQNEEYDSGNDNVDGDVGGVRQSVFNASGFVKLQNLSNKLPIEEINLLVPVPMPVTTVLRSLNVSRSGRQFWNVGGAAADDSKKIAKSTITAAAAATTAATASSVAANAAVVKKHGIQSLADLLRRTELKTVVASSNDQTDKTDETDANKSTTATATATATSTSQTSIHFAQLESYPRRTHNNNLQHLIEYINCQSSDDCWMRQHRGAAAPAADWAAGAVTVIEPNRTQTSSAAFTTSQPDGERRYSEQPDANDGADNYEAVESSRTQTITQRNEGITSPSSTADDNAAQTNANEKGNNDGDGDDEIGDDDHEHDIMFTADSQSAPLYYSPPYLTIHRNRVNVNPDLFRHFRASSPLEINQLQLDDETESAAGAAIGAATGLGQMPNQPQHQHHRFSNRMYQNRDGGVNNFETYALDLEPYLKPPTPPPPTMLSFTPSYTTNIFHAFNDQSSASSALHETDLRSEATAVEPIVSQIKPISLMVEIFPANEYELPGSVFGGGGNNGGNTGDHRTTANAAQQRQQTFGSVSGGANSNRANIASLMSWKLAPFSQNKMRLLVNLFPQLEAPATANG